MKKGRPLGQPCKDNITLFPPELVGITRHVGRFYPPLGSTVQPKGRNALHPGWLQGWL